MRHILLLLALCGFNSVYHAQAQSPDPGRPPAYRVGDAVRITVWGHADLSGQFEIGGDGTIIHPLYQTISIAGMSEEQAEAAIRGFLTRFVSEPEFVVEPLIRIAIGGEVGNPSIYTFSSYANVAQAVTQAGPRPTSRLESVRILRDGDISQVDLTRPYSEVSSFRLQSGDQIMVDRRGNAWRDYIQPAITTAGSIASITWVILRLTNRVR